MASGECTIHALKQMETFGKLFVAPNDKVFLKNIIRFTMVWL